MAAMTGEDEKTKVRQHQQQHNNSLFRKHILPAIEVHLATTLVLGTALATFFFCLRINYPFQDIVGPALPIAKASAAAVLMTTALNLIFVTRMPWDALRRKLYTQRVNQRIRNHHHKEEDETAAAATTAHHKAAPPPPPITTFLLAAAVLERGLLNKRVSIHRHLGVIMVFFATVHTVIHLTITFPTITTLDSSEELALLRNNSMRVDLLKPLRAPLSAFKQPLSYQDLLLRSIPGATGILLVTIAAFMLATSTHHIRSRYYRLWATVHMLWVPFLILLVVHGSQQWVQPPQAIFFLAVPVILICIDRICSRKKLWRMTLVEHRQHQLQHHLPPFRGAGVAGAEDVQRATAAAGAARHAVPEIATVTHARNYYQNETRFFVSGDEQDGPLAVFHLAVPTTAAASFYRLPAGCILRMRIKSISRYEWHPFSIMASTFTQRTGRNECPPADQSATQVASFTFAVRAVGPWTRALHALLLQRLFLARGQGAGLASQPRQTARLKASRHLSQEVACVAANVAMPAISVDVQGPYLGVSSAAGSFHRICMIAGGVGVTPYVSFLTSALDDEKNGDAHNLSAVQQGPLPRQDGLDDDIVDKRRAAVQTTSGPRSVKLIFIVRHLRDPLWSDIVFPLLCHFRAQRDWRRREPPLRVACDVWVTRPDGSASRSALVACDDVKRNVGRGAADSAACSGGERSALWHEARLVAIVRRGRPEWSDIFVEKELFPPSPGAAHRGGGEDDGAGAQQSGVFVCGPASLVGSVQKAYHHSSVKKCAALYPEIY